MNTSVMNQNSLNVLKIQLWPSLICLVLGSVGFVSNGVLFFAVLTSKQLRTNFYFCQMHVAVSSSLWCLTVTIIGLKRLILLFLSQPESCAPADCIWLFYPQSLFKNISLAQASVMGFDRFLGVSMPVNYRTFRLKKLQLANISMWLIPICLISPISFLLISKEAKIPTCTVGQIWQPIVSSIFAGSSLTFDVLTIVTYAGLFAALMYRLHNGKNTGKSLEQIKKSVHFKAALTGFLILGVFTCVAMTADLYTMITNSFDPQIKSQIQPYGNVISLLACNLAFLICILRSSELRGSVREKIRCKRRSSLAKITPTTVKSSVGV